ncbi:collagen alpha-1(I) chain-like [Anser cygnoides]|uniref:collagen alpha-1(I) chain-like n=1 Tax=Anser cygnoides TaxID=8845 RepID=UPI0034D38A1C
MTPRYRLFCKHNSRSGYLQSMFKVCQNNQTETEAIARQQTACAADSSSAHGTLQHPVSTVTQRAPAVSSCLGAALGVTEDIFKQNHGPQTNTGSAEEGRGCKLHRKRCAVYTAAEASGGRLPGPGGGTSPGTARPSRPRGPAGEALAEEPSCSPHALRDGDGGGGHMAGPRPGASGDRAPPGAAGPVRPGPARTQSRPPPAPPSRRAPGERRPPAQPPPGGAPSQGLADNGARTAGLVPGFLRRPAAATRPLPGLAALSRGRSRPGRGGGAPAPPPPPGPGRGATARRHRHRAAEGSGAGRAGPPRPAQPGPLPVPERGHSPPRAAAAGEAGGRRCRRRPAGPEGVKRKGRAGPSHSLAGRFVSSRRRRRRGAQQPAPARPPQGALRRRRAPRGGTAAAAAARPPAERRHARRTTCHRAAKWPPPRGWRRWRGGCEGGGDGAAAVSAACAWRGVWIGAPVWPPQGEAFRIDGACGVGSCWLGILALSWMKLLRFWCLVVAGLLPSVAGKDRVSGGEFKPHLPLCKVCVHISQREPYKCEIPKDSFCVIGKDKCFPQTGLAQKKFLKHVGAAVPRKHTVKSSRSRTWLSKNNTPQRLSFARGTRNNPFLLAQNVKADISYSKAEARPGDDCPLAGPGRSLPALSPEARPGAASAIEGRAGSGAQAPPGGGGGGSSGSGRCLAPSRPFPLPPSLPLSLLPSPPSAQRCGEAALFVPRGEGSCSAPGAERRSPQPERDPRRASRMRPDRPQQQQQQQPRSQRRAAAAAAGSAALSAPAAAAGAGSSSSSGGSSAIRAAEAEREVCQPRLGGSHSVSEAGAGRRRGPPTAGRRGGWAGREGRKGREGPGPAAAVEAARGGSGARRSGGGRRSGCFVSRHLSGPSIFAEGREGGGCWEGPGGDGPGQEPSSRGRRGGGGEQGGGGNAGAGQEPSGAEGGVRAGGSLGVGRKCPRRSRRGRGLGKGAGPQGLGGEMAAGAERP